MKQIYLAPMEGVVDAVVRDLWTRIGGYDGCFTEFIRVTNQLIPDHVYFRECPELETAFLTRTKSQTPAGVPVIVQLLGGDANWITENAVRAVELGSPGIDLNFGCPAKTVNRHDGGASLLLTPERLKTIISKVRAALPPEVPVTAKMRLGFADPSLCLENAMAVEAGGAAGLTVHCRTKTQMYQPPADWTWMPRIREVVGIPLIVNGEIWTAQDALACQHISGCQSMMLGRGALSDPWLARKIKGIDNEIELAWPRVLQLLRELFERCCQVPHVHRQDSFGAARLKQMLRYFARDLTPAKILFDQIKVLRTTDEIAAVLYADDGNHSFQVFASSALQSATSTAFSNC